MMHFNDPRPEKYDKLMTDESLKCRVDRMIS